MIIQVEYPIRGFVHRKGFIAKLARTFDKRIKSEWLFRIGWQETSTFSAVEPWIARVP
jgi:hypothetical protein